MQKMRQLYRDRCQKRITVILSINIARNADISINEIKIGIVL